MNRMSLMQSPPPGARARSAEPSGTVLFVLFFGSLIAAGLIGVWLWNSNAAVREGRAFGAPNQVAAGPPGGGPVPGASPGPGGGAAPGGDAALVQQGQQLANQLGCIACHTTTGQAGLGPSWKGIAGSQRPLAGGGSVVADDAYLRESILNSTAKVVQGFQPVMPAFQGQVNDEQLNALIAYITSLK